MEVKKLRFQEKVLSRLEASSFSESQLDLVRKHLQSEYARTISKSSSEQALRLEKRMWLRIFHARIQAYRQCLRDKIRSRRKFENKKNQFRKFKSWLNEASKFYTILPFAQHEEERRLLRLGDLARYGGHHELARKYYLKIRDGASYNALGLLAEAEHKPVTALYYFTRATATSKAPLSNVQPNIVRLEKFLENNSNQITKKMLFIKFFLRQVLQTNKFRQTNELSTIKNIAACPVSKELDAQLEDLLRSASFSPQFLLEIMVITIHFLGPFISEAFALVLASSAKHRKQVLPALVVYFDWIRATGIIPLKSQRLRENVGNAFKKAAADLSPCRLPERTELADFGALSFLLQSHHLVTPGESKSYEDSFRKSALLKAAHGLP